MIEKTCLIPLPDFQMSNNLLDFLSKCLLSDPNNRFSVEHALNHPFINKDSP
jgi:serine/threonine protein kinase